MSKSNELADIPPETPDDIGELWWDERTKVSMMVNRHLENAMLKLQGLGKTKYDAEDGLRRKWLYILATERDRRGRERHATKTDSVSKN